MSTDTRPGTACCQPKFIFVRELRSKLIQDVGLLTADQNLDLVETRFKLIQDEGLLAAFG